VDELAQLHQQKYTLSEQLRTLEERLFALVAERGVLLVDLGKVEARLRACQLEATKQQYGVEAGSMVTHQGRRYQVVTVLPSPTGKPWVRGLALGECGSALEAFPVYLFDAWQLVTTPGMVNLAQ
jgi:hypothetical protein